MSYKITILGAGLVGSAIAEDLKRNNHDVTVADINKTALDKIAAKSGIHTIRIDITDMQALRNVVSDASLVIGAVPGHIGFNMLKEVISAGKNVVDISFCPEDYLQLDQLAKDNNVTVIPDAGVAPGLSNMVCGYHNRRMEIESFVCMVGGLPVEREWPLQYKAAWSPRDVIEEYTRPARLMRKGEILELPALSELETVNFSQAGQLEAWNSDGLRSLLFTMPHIPNMVEKTLRYPGTTEYLRVLRHLGFFSDLRIDVSGNRVSPVDLTAALLFPQWKLGEGEKEFTAMRMIVKGKENGKEVTHEYNLYDEYNEVTRTTSMARTTGYTCAATATMLLEGLFDRKGVCPPEYVGENEECFRFIRSYLEKRQVNLAMETR